MEASSDVSLGVSLSIEYKLARVSEAFLSKAAFFELETEPEKCEVEEEVDVFDTVR